RAIRSAPSVGDRDMADTLRRMNPPHDDSAQSETPGVANPLHRGVPSDWFVDPVQLGVPGVRRDIGDDNPLAWQADALCAQTDPESFFPEKGGSTRDAKTVCASCDVR